MDTSNIEVEINPEYTMMKKIKTNLWLSQEQIDILEEYEINYHSVNSLNELIRLVSEAYDDTDDDVLANLLSVLSERDYYENYNK